MDVKPDLRDGSVADSYNTMSGCSELMHSQLQLPVLISENIFFYGTYKSLINSVLYLVLQPEPHGN